MLNFKNQIVFLIIIASLIAILLSPARVQCFDMTFYVYNPSGTAAVDNAAVFLFDWDKVQLYGLTPQSFSHVFITDNYGQIARVEKGAIINHMNLELNKDYLLLISTRAKAELKNFTDIFYSKIGSTVKKVSTMDPDKAPKLRFTSAVSSLGVIKLSGDGKIIKGMVRDENGNPLSDVRIELYIDQDGSPSPLLYPFYRFVETNSGQETNYKTNFQMGGFIPDVKYYVKVVGSHKGYVDTFYMDSAGKPKLFEFKSDVEDLGEIQMVKGGKIWGYIKDFNTDSPINNATVTIRAISIPKIQQMQFIDLYRHDPNAHFFEDIPESMIWDRYYYKLDHIHYDATGKYELKGLPIIDYDLYLEAIEYPTQNYATPMYYDGNDGGYNILSLKTIKFDAPNSEYKIDFKLRPGGCIEGSVGYGPLPGQGAIETIKADPNVFDIIPVYIDAYREEIDGSLALIRQSWRIGQGFYAVCGLPPGKYLIYTHDPTYKFYPGKYYDNQVSYIAAKRITLGMGEGDPNIVDDINISLSLGGMLSGLVLDTDGNAIPEINVGLFRVNQENPLNGYYYASTDGTPLSPYLTELDPNTGRFYVWGVPPGDYIVYVNGQGVVINKNTAYLPQYYAPDTNGAMISNKGYPIKVKGGISTVQYIDDIHLNKSGITSGGIISGNVSTTVTGSSHVFKMQVFNADTGLEISNPLYRFDPNNIGNTGDYLLMVQDDGNYIVAVYDTENYFIPHYYNSAQTTIDPLSAEALSIDSSNSNKRYLTQINFVLSESGAWVSGQVFDSMGNGLSGLTIKTKQKILNEDTWMDIAKTAITGSNGEFNLKGLPPVKYKFSVHDPLYTYAAQYYHSDTTKHVYTALEGETWEFDLNNPNQPIFFYVEKGSKIAGRVKNVERAQVYAYLKKDTVTSGGYTTIADPNFILTGLIPGNYIVSFKSLDPNSDYLPVYYDPNGANTDPDLDNISTVEVGSGLTSWIGEVAFVQPGAQIEGIVSISLGSNQEEALPNTYIFFYRISSEVHPWTTHPEGFTVTDKNGFYFMTGLSPGDYWMVVFVAQKRPFFKKLTIKDSDLGNIKQGIDITFPNDWNSNKYRHTLHLEKGLNLIAYPTLMPSYFSGYTSKTLLLDISLISGRLGMSFKAYSYDKQTWNSTSYENIKLEGSWITGASGENFYLRNGKGYLIYSIEDRDLDFWFYPGQTSIWLTQGLNLVGNVLYDPNKATFVDPNIISYTNFATREMLGRMGDDTAVSIHTLDAKQGKWKGTYWMWGKPVGDDIKIEDERGYIVYMKKDLGNWYPKK